jgi:hypothetical protein
MVAERTVGLVSLLRERFIQVIVARRRRALGLSEPGCGGSPYEGERSRKNKLLSGSIDGVSLDEAEDADTDAFQNQRRSVDSAPGDTLIMSKASLTDQALARLTGAPLQKGNRLSLLRNGPETYDEWLAAIARAERWVHLENYLFEADKVGRRFAEALA